MADLTKAELLAKLKAFEDAAAQKATDAARNQAFINTLVKERAEAIAAKERAESKLTAEPTGKPKRVPTHPYLVPPPIPVNDMTECQRYAWRIALTTAILNQKDGRLTADLRKANEANLAKVEQKLIKSYQGTVLVDASHAAEFKAQVDKLLKKHPALAK